MENLTNEQLIEKNKEYEAIIQDQKNLIEQLIQQNQKLAEIASMQKEFINSIKGMMGNGTAMPPQL